MQQQGLIPTERTYHASAMLLKRFLIIQGGYGENCCFNDWNLLDCETWTWKKITPSINLPQSIHPQIISYGNGGILYQGQTF